MNHFTQIPIQWSPDKIYQLPGGIALIPSGRLKLEERHMISYHDSFLFVTKSDSPNLHEAILKSWIPFHAFIFEPSLYSEFEQEKLSDHKSITDINKIPTMPSNNTYCIDYDDIAKQVYFSYEPNINIAYGKLYENYQSLDINQLNLLYLWLMPFRAGIQNLNYQIADTSYLKIASLVTILEVIIGPSTNCVERIICPKCEKDLPNHRSQTESQRWKIFLDALPTLDNVKVQYSQIIKTAFKEVRHPTVHKAGFPTASRKEQESTHEVYDEDRTTQEFREDAAALLGLVISLQDIVRYLLLYKLFNLSFFPELKPLQSTRIILG